jgi:hypothetical protein
MLNVELCGSGDGWGSCAVFFLYRRDTGSFRKGAQRKVHRWRGEVKEKKEEGFRGETGCVTYFHTERTEGFHGGTQRRGFVFGEEEL